MNVDSRQRIGAWAALGVAILAPLQVGLAIATAGDADPFANPFVQGVGALRVAALLVAVVGLDAFYRAPNRSAGSIVLAVGLVGAGGTLVLDLMTLAGLSLGTLDSVATAITGVLIGIWFIGAGTILMARGGGLERVGWPAQLGGLATVAASVTIAIGAPLGDGTATDWLLLLGLFVVVYLVRIWRYVIGGRLPGPGVL